MLRSQFGCYVLDSVLQDKSICCSQGRNDEKDVNFVCLS